VSFVLRLEKGCYLYQFGQYAWTHLILLFVFVPSSFFVSNIFDGIIWFLLPCSLVIVNDIGAYLAGACPAQNLPPGCPTCSPVCVLVPAFHACTFRHSAVCRAGAWGAAPLAMLPVQASCRARCGRVRL